MNWKLAVDTFGETYHLQHLHPSTVSPLFLSNRATFDAFGRNHRLVAARRSFEELRAVPEDAWTSMPTRSYLRAVSQHRADLSARSRRDLAHVPGAHPEETVMYVSLYIPSRWRTSVPSGIGSQFRPADGDCRKGGFPTCEGMQRGFHSPAQDAITFGRNEPPAALSQEHPRRPRRDRGGGVILNPLAGLDPAIHVFCCGRPKAWMPGISRARRIQGSDWRAPRWISRRHSGQERGRQHRAAVGEITAALDGVAAYESSMSMTAAPMRPRLRSACCNRMCRACGWSRTRRAAARARRSAPGSRRRAAPGSRLSTATARNDPADIPALWHIVGEARRRAAIDRRHRARRGHLVEADVVPRPNGVRRRMLHDDTPIPAAGSSSFPHAVSRPSLFRPHAPISAAWCSRRRCGALGRGQPRPRERGTSKYGSSTARSRRRRSVRVMWLRRAARVRLWWKRWCRASDGIYPARHDDPVS